MARCSAIPEAHDADTTAHMIEEFEEVMQNFLLSARPPSTTEEEENRNVTQTSDVDMSTLFEYIGEQLEEELGQRLISIRRPSATFEERMVDYTRILQIKRILAM